MRITRAAAKARLSAVAITDTDVVQNPEPPSLPILPLEIWFIILQFVTDTPQQPVELAPPYSTPALYLTTQQNWVRDASILSKPLRFVSSQWRSLLDPIFWNVISVQNRHRFGSTTKLRNLRDALEASTRNDPQGGVGRFIQDLSFNVHYLGLPDLGRILQCCTRLRGLSLYIRNDWNEDTIPNHLTLPPSLRCITYHKYSGNKPPFPKELADSLFSSNVTSLYLGNGYMGDFPQQLSFPNLEALRMKHFPHEQSAHIATWEMPSLVRLTFVGHVNASTDPVCRRYGPDLSFLEVSSNWYGGWRPVFNSIQPMRKLKQLVLPCHVLDRPPGDTNGGEYAGEIPPIIHLGICGWGISDMAVATVLERVLRLRWSALRCVRFTGYGPDSDNNPRRLDIQGLRSRYVEAGIQVEDRCGRNLFDIGL